jgi:thymidylate kinase
MTSHRIDRLLSRARVEADLKWLSRATDHHGSEQNVPSVNGKTGRVTAMASLANGQQARPAAVNQDPGQHDGPGRILLGVFECFDHAGIPYCVLHGYENYPERITSDVDCLIAANITPDQVAALLYKRRQHLGAEIVRTRGYYFNLAGKNSCGTACFLELDLSVNFELNGRQFYRGDELLAGRRRHQSFWVPAPEVEFGCYLIKKVAKRQLEPWQTRRLSELFHHDREGCRKQVARFWSESSSALITAAAESGDWQPVKRRLGKLGRELRRGATLRHPLQVGQHWLGRMSGRLRRALRPDSGLDVVFLGPDGAGKSTVVHCVTGQLAGGFARTACYSFPPALLQRFHRPPQGPDPLPHAAPLRSWPASVLRAVGYWFVYSTLGYLVTVHLALARAGLVMHDRHLFDTLVDPRRYRYGGPLWLLRLICRLVPKPDLVFLLDAPPEVLHARKQEIAFDETARQREAYITLVGPMRNGHVVDAARPLEQVVGEVNEIILQHVAARTERRLGMPLTA